MDLPGNRQTWSAIDATLEQLMKSVEALENGDSQETKQTTQPQTTPQQAPPKSATAPSKNGLWLI